MGWPSIGFQNLVDRLQGLSGGTPVWRTEAVSSAGVQDLRVNGATVGEGSLAAIGEVGGRRPAPASQDPRQVAEGKADHRGVAPFRSASSFHPPGVKQTTGCFLLHRPMARRPAGGRSAARGISTGVTSRGTPSRAVEGGQPVRVGLGFQTVWLGFRRSRAARRPPLLKQMITKMVAAVNPCIADLRKEVRTPTQTGPGQPGIEAPRAA